MLYGHGRADFVHIVAVEDVEALDSSRPSSLPTRTSANSRA